MNWKDPKVFDNGWIVGIGFLVSFVSGIWGIFGNKNAMLLALACIIITLLLVLLMVYHFLRKFISNSHESPFDSNSTFTKYSTKDGNIIEYEIYKHIQCKKLIASEYHHRFKWSGRNTPTREVVKSNLQTIESILNRIDPDDYDELTLKFKQPLAFNEQTVIHINFCLDDSDHQSETQISTRVKYKIEVLHLRVELGHKDNNPPARVIRFKSGAQVPIAQKTVLKAVDFNTITRSYEYHIINPDVGYIYRIEWDR